MNTESFQFCKEFVGTDEFLSLRAQSVKKKVLTLAVNLGDLPSQMESSSTIPIQISTLYDNFDMNPTPS